MFELQYASDMKLKKRQEIQWKVNSPYLACAVIQQGEKSIQILALLA